LEEVSTFPLRPSAASIVRLAHPDVASEEPVAQSGNEYHFVMRLLVVFLAALLLPSACTRAPNLVAAPKVGGHLDFSTLAFVAARPGFEGFTRLGDDLLPPGVV
jgi:hypothetical protein